MPLITIAPLVWINTDAVGAITSDTQIKPSENTSFPDDKVQRRVTVFKSFQGAELVALVGQASFSTDLHDSNHELKAMRYIHDEAIAAVREERDAIPYNQSEKYMA